MKPSEKSKTSRLRAGLWIVMALAVAAVVVLFIAHRRATDTGTDLIRDLPAGIGLSIENLRHTASREGRTEWQLKAVEAQLTPDRQRAHLKQVAVVFFLDDGTELSMQADEGSLETATNDLEARGHVTVLRQGYRLDTDRLRYAHGQRAIVSDAPVVITGNRVQLRADSMTIDIEKRTAFFKGNVHGTIRESLAL